MDIRILAILLLVGHFISVFFTVRVLLRQISLFKFRVQPGIQKIRRRLFTLALLVFSGNVAPIVIDGLTIGNLITRSTNHVNKVGVVYSISNAVIFAASAFMIWVSYKLAAGLVLEDQQKALTNNTGSEV